MRKPLEKGEYAFFSDHKRIDPDKPWAVGWICHIYIAHAMDGGNPVAFIAGTGDLQPFEDKQSIFKHARRITLRRGQLLIRLLRPRQRRISDQIWEVLIAEYRKSKAMKWYTGNLDGRRQGLIMAKSQQQAAELSEVSIHTFTRCWHVINPRPEFESLKDLTLYTHPFDAQQEWTEGRCPLPKKEKQPQPATA